LGAAPAKVAKPEYAAINLTYDSDVASTNAQRGNGAMDSKGRAYPAEQLPATLTVEDATFKLGSAADGGKNALACRGQEITLPQGDHDRVYLLWSSSDGDVKTQIQIDGK